MNWRLILDGAHSGVTNMARDEALLRALAQPHARPTLRFYNWNPACLSLGRFQRLPSHLQVLADEATDAIVRRPTGGRAVWHENEITYCAVFPLEILPLESRGVTSSYRWISEGFLRGLQQLGIDAQLSSAHKSNTKSGDDNCFLAAAQCDTVVEDRKLIGAAQCRISIDNRVLVLQHGSILLDINWQSWRVMLGMQAEAMRGRVVTLRELGFAGQAHEVQTAIVAGMESSCGVRWENGEFSAGELQCARALEEDKYRDLDWNANEQSRVDKRRFGL